MDFSEALSSARQAAFEAESDGPYSYEGKILYGQGIPTSPEFSRVFADRMVGLIRHGVDPDAVIDAAIKTIEACKTVKGEIFDDWVVRDFLRRLAASLPVEIVAVKDGDRAGIAASP